MIHTSSLADAQVLASFTSSQVNTGTLSTVLEIQELFLNFKTKEAPSSQELFVFTLKNPKVRVQVEFLSLFEKIDFLSLKLGLADFVSQNRVKSSFASCVN